MHLTPSRKQSMAATLREALTIIEQLPESRTCRLCDRFTEAGSYCAYWNAEVPAEAIEAGCDEFDEGVPF